MTIEQIAAELKQVPDAALQQESQNPSPSVPSYLLAAETNRRLSARNAANSSQNGGAKPTILQQLANSLTAPPVNPPPPGQQAPQLNPTVPADQMAQQPTNSPSQQFDDGGYVEHHADDGPVPYADPSSYDYGYDGGYGGDVPVYEPPSRSPRAAAITEAPLVDAKIDPSSAPAAAPAPRDLPVWSESLPPGIRANLPGAYAGPPPPAAAPATSAAAPAAPKHHGLQGFFDELAPPQPGQRTGFLGVMDRLAPLGAYLGDVGAGMAAPHGSLAGGVALANETVAARQKRKEDEDYRKQELGLRRSEFGLQSSEAVQRALQAGARIVGSDDMTTGHLPVMTPGATINGVQIDAPKEIADSGTLPFNPSETQALGKTRVEYPTTREKQNEAVHQYQLEQDIKAQELAKEKTAERAENEALFNQMYPPGSPNMPTNEAKLRFIHGEKDALKDVPVAPGSWLIGPSGQATVKVPSAEKAPTAEQNQERFQNIVGKLNEEGLIGPNTLMHADQLLSAIQKSNSLTKDEKNIAVGFLGSKNTPGSAGTINEIRVTGMEQSRLVQAMNTQTKQLEYVSALDVLHNPGLYAPAGAAAKALSAGSQFNDLQYTIDTAKTAINHLGEIDAPTRAAISFALRDIDSKSAVAAFMKSELISKLSPQQRDAVQSLALLHEGAMSIRGFAGLGQGSDVARHAVWEILPGASIVDKNYALGQVNKFEQVVHRLRDGLARVGNLNDMYPDGTQQAQPGGGQTGGGQTGGGKPGGGPPPPRVPKDGDKAFQNSTKRAIHRAGGRWLYDDDNTPMK